MTSPLARTIEEIGPRAPRYDLSGGLPVRSTAFYTGLGVAPYSRYEDLPPEILSQLESLRPAVGKLGEKFDYERLAQLAEQGKEKLKPDVYFKMAATAMLGQTMKSQLEGKRRTGTALIAANEFAKQGSLGIIPGIPEETIHDLALDPQAVSVAKMVGAVAGIATSGKLIYSALSKATLLPKIGPVLQKIPERVKEAMLGIGTGAILDAARPDGMPEDPAAIDVSARIAKPIAEVLGGGETAERIGLGIGGGTLGLGFAVALLPVVRGLQMGREARYAAQLTDDEFEVIRDGLQRSGIAVGTGDDKRAVVAKLFANQNKISQSERLASISAADETRMDFVLNQLYSDPAFIGPPKLPGTKVVDPQGQPLRVYHGTGLPFQGPISVKASEKGYVKGMSWFTTDPKEASSFVNLQTSQGMEAANRLYPSYLNVKNPLHFDDPIPETLKPFLRKYDPETAANMDAGHVRSLDDFTEDAGSLDIVGDMVPEVKRLGFDGMSMQGKKWHMVFDDRQIVPAFASHDAQYLAAVFRANPGGLSIAKGVTDVRAADDVVKRMGLNVVALKAGDDMILMRPQVAFPEHGVVTTKIQNNMKDFTDQVRAQFRGKPSTRLSILSDGTVVKGDYNPVEMLSRFKVRVGEFSPEVALREHLGLMDVQVLEGGVVQVNLPSRVTQRQATVLGRMADRGPPQMILNSATPGKSVTLDQPFGMQVEDAMSNLIQGAGKPRITADVVKKVQQYQKEGVFQGQAGVLPDGYPVEILRKSGKKIAYRDPITKAIHRIEADNISILPTSLEGEFAPSRQIFEAMDEGERALFARLRRGVNEGLAKPINNIRDLEGFASTRGKLVNPLGKGRVRVFDQNTGESQIFDNLKAATAYVRGSLSPLPDLTPPEISELLGFKPNLGSFAGGPPARYGEPIPITEAEFAKAFETKTVGMLPPGAAAQVFLPTRALSEVLSRKYGMPFDKVFANLQSATVHRQNFVAAWSEGKGPGLPEGVMPLEKIWKLAGKPNDAKQELMGDLKEAWSDPVARKAIEAQLKPNEIKAVEEARKWFGQSEQDGLFKALGVEAEWLDDYLPHIRAHSDVFGTELAEGWRMTRGTPLPKSLEWAADFARDGTLNIYEKRLFVSAAQYLQAGARTRYLNQAMTDAKRLISAIPDNAVKGPLVNYIEALKGWEFLPQRAAIDASFTHMLRNLGAGEQMAKDLGEKLTMSLLGMSYSATMAFRAGLAVRNMTQILQTTWPLLGSTTDDVFAVGLGRALTKAGRDDAIRAGAISVKQNAVFAGDEAISALPSMLKGMTEYGFKMYDGADVFARSVTFNVAKLRSERAIAKYGKAIASGKDAAAAQRALVKESGAMILSKRFADEYLRRVATSPADAGDFLGKQLTDITQFLYGRGNQMRWMRTIPGRFFGQFGTWPLWYIDFLRRSTYNMWKNGYQREAMQFLGKIALVDLTIYEAGRRVNLDMRRWMGTPSIFGAPPLGRSPGQTVLIGVQDLVRGTSEATLGTYDSPANKQRLAIAQNTLKQVGLAYIPNYHAVRDIGRMMNAQTPTELAAATLAVRPSAEYTVQQRMDMLFAPGRMSTDIDLEQEGFTDPTAVEVMLKGMEMTQQRPKIEVQGTLPAQPQGITPPMGAPPVSPRGATGEGPVKLPDYIKKGESRPNLQ